MIMENFVAIDLETANEDRFSICEIGITEVINGMIQEPKSWLVQPPGNDYSLMSTWIHGISSKDTENSPLFPEVWQEVAPYLDGKTVVAHNTSFDMYALRDAFDYYKMEYPTFEYYCTLRIARYIIKGCYSYSLNVVLNHLGINIERHHRADCDSLGCAKLLLKCLEIDGHKLEELEDIYHFNRGKFAPGTFSAHKTIRNDYVKRNINKFIESLQIDQDSIDTDNYFYGKSICFTGTCMFGTRADLLKKVAELGGIPTDNVTTKTDVLVVGQQDYRIVGESGLSSKQKRAIELLNKGQDIEILSESEFLSRL